MLLYQLSADLAKADRAERLLATGGTVSVQVLKEFASIAARKLEMWIGEIKIILSTIRSICAVKPLEVETHDVGLDPAERYRYSIYGCLIVAAALRAGCSTLYSEDLQNGQLIDRLTIVNPFTAT